MSYTLNPRRLNPYDYCYFWDAQQQKVGCLVVTNLYADGFSFDYEGRSYNSSFGKAKGKLFWFMQDVLDARAEVERRERMQECEQDAKRREFEYVRDRFKQGADIPPLLAEKYLSDIEQDILARNRGFSSWQEYRSWQKAEEKRTMSWLAREDDRRAEREKNRSYRPDPDTLVEFGERE